MNVSSVKESLRKKGKKESDSPDFCFYSPVKNEAKHLVVGKERREEMEEQEKMK